ncbi:hypothetical protein, partial [Klebsiella pneumoniae]
RAYCLKTQPATGETYPKSDLFNKAGLSHAVSSSSASILLTILTPRRNMFVIPFINIEIP